MHRARERLVRLAKTHGRPTPILRAGRQACADRPSALRARQFKRANRALRTLRTFLGRTARDIVRKIKGKAELERAFAHPLSLAWRVRDQRQNQRSRKVYSLHAPEVECIGKGKAHRPYEFGVKVSAATTLNRSKGGQFIAHVKAAAGQSLRRSYARDGHPRDEGPGRRQPRAHRHGSRLPRPQRAAQPQAQGLYLGPETTVTEAIKRDLRRRSAVQPCVGHLKSEHRMGRNHLAHAAGDAPNAVLAGAGYNVRRLLVWLAMLLRVWFAVILAANRQSENLAALA